MSVRTPRIRLAEHAGFCAGVERAVRIARETGRSAMRAGSPGVVTLGPLVHNPAVVADLAHCGVQQVNSVDEASGHVAVIPSHGLSPAIVQDARWARLAQSCRFEAENRGSCRPQPSALNFRL